MKRIIILLVAISFGLALGGCSKKNKRGHDKSMSMDHGDSGMKGDMKGDMKGGMHGDMHGKNMHAKSGKAMHPKKRIYCSSKKTYKKGSACWHWKKGARK